jgi:hypothetical protein
VLLNKKGQTRMIEAFLAVLVILSASVFSITLYYPTASSDDEKMLKTLGMQVLMELDNNGTLGKFIDKSNWAAVRESLEILLPIGVSYNVTVFSEEMSQINNSTVSNGLKGQNIVSVEYFCASQSSEVRFYLVRLQLALVR